MNERDIEDEARALYEDYRAYKPKVVDAASIPPWEDQRREDVRNAWRAAAIGSLKRRAAAITIGGPIDPDPPEGS